MTCNHRLPTAWSVIHPLEHPIICVETSAVRSALLRTYGYDVLAERQGRQTPSDWRDASSVGGYMVRGPMREWRRFLKDESGSELVEWIALTLILLLATAAVLNEIGGQLKRIFKDILGQLESVPEG